MPIVAHSDLALRLANPYKQMKTLRGMLRQSSLSVGRAMTLPPSDFKPQTDTEILLLTCTLPGDEELSPTARTLEWLWRTTPQPFSVNIGGNIKTVKDVAEGCEAVGFRWVAFDPMGVVVPKNKDFRADLFIGRTPSRIPRLDYFLDRRDPRELAGIEAFMAIRLVPRLMHEAWDGQTVILPRLEAVGTRDGSSPGAITFNISEHAMLGWVNWWEYNYYGHVRIVPTIRELT